MHELTILRNDGQTASGMRLCKKRFCASSRISFLGHIFPRWREEGALRSGLRVIKLPEGECWQKRADCSRVAAKAHAESDATIDRKPAHRPREAHGASSATQIFRPANRLPRWLVLSWDWPDAIKALKMIENGAMNVRVAVLAQQGKKPKAVCACLYPGMQMRDVGASKAYRLAGHRHAPRH